MKTKQLQIQGEMRLTCVIYEMHDIKNDVSLDYIERSKDHWHSDTEESIDINKEKAIEIINFLKESFDL